MLFTLISIIILLLLSFLILPSSVPAQATTQQQVCTNACAAANACDTQCNPGAGADTYAACLCQGGCLCNAEICLQCCQDVGSPSYLLRLITHKEPTSIPAKMSLSNSNTYPSIPPYWKVKLIRGYLNEGLSLLEMEYQPNE